MWSLIIVVHAGFRDSASSFQHDSKAERLDVTYRSHVKSGLLIYLIQRGLQYEELAAQVDRVCLAVKWLVPPPPPPFLYRTRINRPLVQDGTIQKPARPFQFFPSAPGLVLDEDEGVGSDGHQLDEGDDDEEGSVTLQSKSPPATSTTSTNAKKHPIEDGVNGVSKKRRKKASNGLDGDVLMADPVPSPPPPPPPPLPPLTDHLPATNGCDAGTQIEDPVEVVAADTLALEEDDAILYCVWNPGRDTPTLLASGGLVARIWDVPPDAAFSQATKSCLLSHEPSRKSTGKASITAIRWSPDGSKLASGSYDGQTRTWTADGIMEHNMLLHDAPVSSLRWNAPASTLLALSCDGKMIAWDTAAGDQRRSWDLGSDASLVEIEWISESQFMACAENGDLYQFDVAVDGHLDVRRLHDGEVGCLAWDQASSTIATGGNDMSIRVRTLCVRFPSSSNADAPSLPPDMAQTKQRLQSRSQIGRPYGSHRFGCLATRPRLLRRALA